MSEAVSTRDGTRSQCAIELRNVCKAYKLYHDVTEQALDVLGLLRLAFWKTRKIPHVAALADLTLKIPHGQRVGMIGANGAGKTTLLKLITGNFTPTSGTVTVDGTVQALMQVGLGFHAEFTGYENMRSSLLYNGLSGEQFEAAMADVIEFVELGEYLHQPVKTYSLGMRARLQFAAATAIKPDILIVDEVLGAGDAYFSAKSSDRMANLAHSGCTLVLVSHSMQQILQFCERVIWLDQGRIEADDGALRVVREYEAWSHRRRLANRPHRGESPSRGLQWQRDSDASLLTGTSAEEAAPEDAGEAELSRWERDSSLKISSVRTFNAAGDECDQFKLNEPVTFEIEIRAEVTGSYPCRYVVLLFTEDGRPIVRHVSDACNHQLEAGQRRSVRIHYRELLLGVGTYVFSVAVYERFDPDDRSSASWYDLLSRSFRFDVVGYDSFDPSIFHHPALWEGLDDDRVAGTVE